MKRILVVTPFVPCNKTAGQHYMQQLTIDLARDFFIDLCYFRYGNDAPYLPSSDNIRVAKSITVSTGRKLLNCCKFPFLHPLFTCRFHFGLAFFLYRQKLKFDGFYFDHSQTFIYSFFVPGAKKYLMAQDVIAQKYARRKGWHHWVNYLLARISEQVVLRWSGGNILCFSDKDRLIIQQLYGLEANQVDLYLGDQVRSLDYNQVEYTARFAFFGAWNRPDNMEGLSWFLDAVLPMLDKNIQFIIIGGGMSPADRDKISRLANVTVTGFVDDPYPLLAGCAGLVAPLFQGAGVKVKVLEALACGTPVIGTSIALEGVELLSDANSRHCESAREFADAITSLQQTDMTTKLKLREDFLSSYPKHLFRELLKNDL